MPWYIVLITIIIAQTIFMLMINSKYKSDVLFLNSQINDVIESNKRLTNTITSCELSKKSSIQLAEEIASTAIMSERERYRIETELCKLGWGDSVQTMNRRHSDNEKKETTIETIKPDDRFDAAISGLLKNAYDCATSGICVRPDPTVGSN